MRKILLFLALIIFTLTSCASEGNADKITIGENTKVVRFIMSVKGEVKGDVSYNILFNTNGDKIQPDDLATFTDMIHFVSSSSLQRPEVAWYHKTNPADVQMAYIADLSAYTTVSADNSSIIITFSPDDPSAVFNNYISSTFTVQALIASISGELVGRFIDAMGPQLSSASIYSITVNKFTGIISELLPASYPFDAVGDYIQANVPSGTPSDNCDLISFRIEFGKR